MKVVGIHEAKTHLSRLVDRVTAGEEITIARSGKPVAKLVKFVPLSAPREPGIWRDRVWMSSDFDDLDAELVELFEEGE